MHAPGKISIKGATKSFTGPTSMSHTFNEFPQTTFQETFRACTADGNPIANRPYKIYRNGNVILSGVTDAQGHTQIQKSEFIEGMQIRFERGQG